VVYISPQHQMKKEAVVGGGSTPSVSSTPPLVNSIDTFAATVEFK